MSAARQIQLTPAWQQVLSEEFDTEYMAQLRAFLQQEKRDGQEIYPPGAQMFNALNTTPFDHVKVVIIGQDPYHGPGQAHGLSFSVPAGVRPPPSLQNIFKELHRDLGLTFGRDGDLTVWAEQGVLLLNAVLSVRARQANSHQGRGWERFTDAVIDRLNRERSGLVFLLWGSYAQKKGALIDRERHCVLTAPHPSPLSAHRGFIGCGHFSAANDHLQRQGMSPIDWSLPSR